MEQATEHVSLGALDAALEDIRRAPADCGTVELIVIRPRDREREVIAEAELDVDTGVAGDNWFTRHNRRRADGRPDPEGQVTVMSARAVAAIAGEQERWPLAGDQLYVDFDLSHQNVPVGTQLAIGSAVLEVTAKPHNGCPKFRRHFGADAVRFVNASHGKALRLRGLNAKVVRRGVVRTGDAVRKL